LTSWWKMYKWQSTQYQDNLCEKLKVTKSRFIYSQSTWHQKVIDEPFQKTICHLSFWIKWKHYKIRFSENMISMNHTYTQNSILRKTVRNTYNWSYKKKNLNSFRTSEKEQVMQNSQKTASFLKETREQEASNVSKEQSRS